MSNCGLVLTGGGARAAYQVGALKALNEILRPQTSPFQIVTGISAGAINCMAVAAGANNFPDTVDKLWDVWTTLTPERIYRTDSGSLLSIGSSWLNELALGGLFGFKAVNHLLDTTPLRKVLEENIDPGRLPDHFKSGRLQSVALSATNYLTGGAVTFFDGTSDLNEWRRSSRLGIREPLSLDHVMASSAIPVFFPPVAINGTYYGDGSIRLKAPLSPAVHLGSDKIVAIGVRYPRSREQAYDLQFSRTSNSITLSDIAGTILNAVFLESLDADLERFNRINRTLSLLEDEKDQPELKRIPILTLMPSRDLSELVSGEYPKFPALLRHLFKGIGVQKGRSSDLLSYLLFDPAYLERLMSLGYDDTWARRREIEQFWGES